MSVSGALSKFTAAVLMLIALGSAGWSRADMPNEAAVKVAFLYNFFKFIEWPDSAGTGQGYNLCITDPDDFGDSLQVLTGKTVNGKPLYLLLGIADKDIKNCHMLYIGQTENAAGYLRALRGLPVVTISDTPDFVNHKGMIGLIHDGNRLNFEVNLETAEADNIYISAQLLKLAKYVATK